MALIFVRNRIVICLLSLFAFMPLAPQAGAAQIDVQPSLTSVTASAAVPGSIVVSGHSFTPGGLVYIALYDQWGVTQHETRWVIASESIHHPGPVTTAGPNLGFTPGGNVRESFELAAEAVYGPNGSQDPAQGYLAGNLSPIVTEDFYGPNGSQDPAQGYVAADDGAAFATTCDAPLMARAFDQGTNTWSNLLDVEVACGE